MHRTVNFRAMAVAILLALSITPMLAAQSAPATQITAVRAGRMFDPKSGTNLTNQVILIQGEKITRVGPADQVPIPADARVIDLIQATVLPGLIDGHVHFTDAQGNLQHQMMIALQSATQSLNAGFTTQSVHGHTRRWLRGCGIEARHRERTGERSAHHHSRIRCWKSRSPHPRITRWTSCRCSPRLSPTAPRRCVRRCANWRTTAPNT